MAESGDNAGDVDCAAEGDSLLRVDSDVLNAAFGCAGRTVLATSMSSDVSVWVDRIAKVTDVGIGHGWTVCLQAWWQSKLHMVGMPAVRMP
jgi:hypothetical protein